MANKPIQIIGIKEDLKRLNKLAPDLRRDITKSYRAFMAPVIADARSNIPAGIGQTQMRGFSRKWRHIMPWDKAVANRGITVKIDTRRARKKNLQNGVQYETVGAFIIQQKNPAGIVFDIAGRGGRFGWKYFNSQKDDVREKGIRILERAVLALNMEK